MTRTSWVVTTVVIALATASDSARAQFTSCNVTLRSWLDLPDFTPVPANGNSCWGYVSPGGQEYALMGLENQVAVVRITDPDNPVIVGSISHTNSLWVHVRAYGNYAYAGNESAGGLDVIDLTNVDSGVVTLVQRFTGSGLDTIHSMGINPASGHLYLAGTNLALGGVFGSIVAVSLANPIAPVIAGQWSMANGANYTHEPHVISYTSGPYAGKEIAFCFNGGSGMRILDVTNKANMVPMGPNVTYPGLTYCHQGWTDATRTYLYVNDEINDTLQTLVFNVTNLAAPTLVSTFSASSPTTDHNIYIRDGIIYEANYKSGIHLLETSNPLVPLEIGFFDTYPEDNTFGYQGAWNQHPFFPSGTVLVSDIDRGLFVLDVSEAVNNGVAFSYPSGRPETIDPAGATTLAVNVTGPGANPQAGAATLHVNRGAGYVSLPLTETAANAYEANFPLAVCEQTVEYYISVEAAGGGTQFNPCDAPASVFSTISSGTIPSPVFADNFETNQSWTSGPNTASTGAWVRNNPIGTGAQPEDDHTTGLAVNCFFTGQNPGGSLGDGDVDGGTARINSPAINLTGIDAVVRYYRWYFERDLGGDDGFVVEVSNNNGTNWTVVESLSPGAGGWTRAQFKVSDFVAPTAQVKVRFSASDGPAVGDIVEAAIDDVQIGLLVCPTQDADVDEDADADLFDFALFCACFTGQGAEPSVPTLYDLNGQPECDQADLDLDGDVDLADYDLFEDGLTGP